MPNREFLENTSLYKKFYVDIPYRLSDIPKPSVHMYCDECKSEQTFSMTNEYYHHSDEKSDGQVVLANYLCASCRKFRRYFLIKISEDRKHLVKVGQYLPWDISIDKKLERMLGEHSGLYKKGLTCESQGYGVAAYAYYRRIVELIIDKLLDDIKDIIPDAEKQKYDKALEATKKAKNASEKIDLVKDLLPATLRPGGINPLSTLHDVLSSGIHEETDDECMDLAEHVKQPLVFLVNQVIESKEASRQFSDGMKKLLEKRTKK